MTRPAPCLRSSLFVFCRTAGVNTGKDLCALTKHDVDEVVGTGPDVDRKVLNDLVLEAKKQVRSLARGLPIGFFAVSTPLLKGGDLAFRFSRTLGVQFPLPAAAVAVHVQG